MPWEVARVPVFVLLRCASIHCPDRAVFDRHSTAVPRGVQVPNVI